MLEYRQKVDEKTVEQIVKKMKEDESICKLDLSAS